MFAWKEKRSTNGTVRWSCPHCDSTQLTVEYGPLDNPKSGKAKKGLFGIYPNCKFRSRLHAR
jgi:hypothetical protein